jgi:methionyl-tRNA formyltransferase
MQGTQSGDLGDVALKRGPLCVVFVTQDDPFYVRIFFEEFVQTCEERGEIKAVVIAPAMGKGFFGLLRQMYSFYGGWNFVRVGTRYSLYKLISKLPAWARGKRFFSVEQVCRHHGVRVMRTRDLNSPEFLAQLAQWRPDLIVSVAAPQIFREALIRLPRLGCINIHNSKLPRYRGMLPNFWQMFYGEKTVGTTIHRINAGIDDGDILMQTETPICAEESLDALIRRTKRLGARLMIEMLARFRAGEVPALANRAEEATYFTFPTRRDVEEFRRRGYRLL